MLLGNDVGVVSCLHASGHAEDEGDFIARATVDHACLVVSIVESCEVIPQFLIIFL